jgi:hypothetical protein
MTYRDDLEAAHARIAALEAQVASERESEDSLVDRMRADHARELAEAQRETEHLRQELAQSRDESARYVERIRILQDEQVKLRGRATSVGAPVVLDRGAPERCPHCHEAGLAVTLLRDPELTPGVCPNCANITLLR